MKRPAWLAVSLFVMGLLSPACAKQAAQCAICHMVVPDGTATLAMIGGRRQIICDPRCALTEQAQTKRAIHLTQVTDFTSGEPLDPRSAYFVTGSDTAPDVQREQRAGERMWPAAQASLEWHRCLPSVLAFRSREAALVHLAAHGGRLMRYQDLGFSDQRPQP